MRLGWMIGWLMVLSATAQLGCDNGGSESSDTSGVSGDKKLLELNSSEGQKVCEFYARKRAASLAIGEERYCNAWGAHGAESVEDCQAEREECLEFDDYAARDEELEDCNEGIDALSDSSIGGDCTATVAEFEACVHADRRALSRYAEHASCADESTFREYVFRTASKECKDMYGKCPRLEGDFASLL